AKFLELGLTPSDSEKFLTQPVATGFSPKGANGAHKNHFHRAHSQRTKQDLDAFVKSWGQTAK
ncbi:MAG: hypothetical protein ACLFS7_02835, partial [Desulfosudaceae bacterium]